MTSWPYDIGPVSVTDALAEECPKCSQPAASPCLYTTDTFTYLAYPEYGPAPKHHKGDVMKATTVHQERRDAVRRERMKTRQGGTVTTATPGVRGAAAAMRAWDVEEFERMRAWLAEYGWLLMDAGLVRRPDGSVRGDSYAMPGHSTMPRSERVTDTWSGDREHLIASFGDLDLPVEQHEHAHHDGCYFAHAHENGQERHGHTYVCRDEGCHHIMMQEVS
jgi:hypothetical protein